MQQTHHSFSGYQVVELAALIVVPIICVILPFVISNWRSTRKHRAEMLELWRDFLRELRKHPLHSHGEAQGSLSAERILKSDLEVPKSPWP